MHRTQVLLERRQYERLKAESERTGRSIGALIRQAIDERFGEKSPEELRLALRRSRGAWAGRAVDGAEYVDRVRHGLGERFRDLGWD